MSFEEMVDTYEVANDPHATALAVLGALHVSKKATDVLVAPLTRAVLIHFRDRTRRIERLVGRGVDLDAWDDDPEDPVILPPRESMTQKRFLAQFIAIDGTGLRLTVGEMTVEDHRRRIEYLKGKIGGLNRTIRQHEDYIALIEATPGAKTLDDVAANGGRAA